MEHKNRTLHKNAQKKPGALAGSTAFQQAQPELQKIYHDYYNGKEKEFVQLLEFIGQKSLADVNSAIKLLQKISPLDINTEKIKAICIRSTTYGNHKSDKGISDIEIKSRDILNSYGMLLISTGERFMEVSIA